MIVNNEHGGRSVLIVAEWPWRRGLAGVAGLMLVLPLLGVVMVLGETLGEVVTDPRLRARHAFAKRLRHHAVTRDLPSG